MELEKKKYWILFYGLVIGILFDVLFYNKTLGISYPVFIFLILIVIAVVFYKDFGRLKNKAWIWSIPIIMLSLTFSIYSNQILKILNFLIIPYLLVMMISLVSDTNRSDWPDVRFLLDFLKRVFIPFRFIHIPFITFFRIKGDDGQDKRRVLPRIAIGLLISIPILALIIWLLSSADIVFKDIFINIPVSKIIKHFFLILAITVYAISFLWSLLKAYDEKKQEKYNKIRWKRFLDPVILITILFLLNVVFTVFSIIQFKYLFGGESFILPSAYTYAEYARRGFFELVVVAVINFIILLIAISFIKKENKKTHLVSKILLSLLAGFTFVMLSSAFYRMLVYEQAYGFTYLRIFVQAFMILMFFLFIINMVFIWYQKLPLIKGYFITTLVVYIMLNFANVDVIIARNNIYRYEKTGQIDMEYLKELSYDAVPEMGRLLSDDSKKEAVISYFNEIRPGLETQISWQSFNLSRSSAIKTIERYTQK